MVGFPIVEMLGVGRKHLTTHGAFLFPLIVSAIAPATFKPHVHLPCAGHNISLCIIMWIAIPVMDFVPIWYFSVPFLV
jgi:hypothetical protein